MLNFLLLLLMLSEDLIFTHTGTSEGKEKYYLISKGCMFTVLS